MSSEADPTRTPVPLALRASSPPRLVALWRKYWSQFWAIPALCTLVAVLAGIGLPLLDSVTEWGEGSWNFGGGAEAARSILSSIAGAMISVTGLVFSVTMVVLQLASNQFTPRVLRSFLEGRIAQWTLGLFVASFVYALVVLQSVRSGDDDGGGFVPRTSVTAATLLVITSIGVFLAYIHMVTRSVSVAVLLKDLRLQGERIIAASQDRGPEEADAVPRPNVDSFGVIAKGTGWLTNVNIRGLIEVAKECDGSIEVVRRLETYVVEGQVVARVHGEMENPEDIANSVRSCLTVESSPASGVDLAFTIRQIVDVASRALSPGINDPTTAVYCIHAIHALLRRVVTIPARHAVYRDSDDVPRVWLAGTPFHAMLDLAVTEPALFGKEVPSVRAALVGMLTDLTEIALPEYQDAIAQQLNRLHPSPQDAAT